MAYSDFFPPKSKSLLDKAYQTNPITTEMDDNLYKLSPLGT